MYFGVRNPDKPQAPGGRVQYLLLWPVLGRPQSLDISVMNARLTTLVLFLLATFATISFAQESAPPPISLDAIQGGWWSNCEAPAVEFLIKGNQYSGDFFGSQSLTLSANILTFKDGLIDGHSIYVTNKPMSFQIFSLSEMKMVLRPLSGNPHVGDWILMKCT